jgi:hypothetical protein
MKKIYIILLVILNIFALIGFVSSIIYLITYIKYKKYEPFLEKTIYNDIHCGKLSCFPDIIDLPFPTFEKDNYIQDIAKYCIYLIQRIYDAVDNDSKFIPPKGVKVEKEINYDKTLFSVICSYQNNIIIVFRGTEYIEEWMRDIDYQQVFYLKNSKNTSLSSLADINLGPSVHKGFYRVYNDMKNSILSKIEELNPDKTKNIIITGHSLGSGVSTILSADLYYSDYKNIVCYLFASPRVGNAQFAALIGNTKLYNIINNLDIVPTLPIAVAPNLYNINQPYIYYNCGEQKTFSDNWDSIANNHGLGIYLKNLPSK